MRDRLFRSSGGRAALVDNDAGALSAALVRALTPDIALTPPSPDFGFVHRHSEAADIYFVANTGSRPLHASARIRVRGAGAEWWNPIDGSTAAADLQVGDRTTATAIDLQPYESRVLVFSRTLPIVAIGARAAPRSPSTLDISTGWNVRFGGSSTQARFESLRDWTADETTRFFSGVAAYEKEVAVPPDMTSGGRSLRLELGEGRPIPMERLTSGMRAWLDPPVREASVVFVNGRRAGSTWTPPYAVDVTGLIRAGANTLRIDVANTAINAMAGRPLPDYRLLNLRYGVRFEPQDMDKVRPAPSGLTGPIRLVAR
jgi:hypothetical protein